LSGSFSNSDSGQVSGNVGDDSGVGGHSDGCNNDDDELLVNHLETDKCLFPDELFMLF
jgi:hypothetical protein